MNCKKSTCPGSHPCRESAVCSRTITSVPWGGVLSEVCVSQAARTSCQESCHAVWWALRVPQGPVQNIRVKLTCK